jgi:hypothetical protein
MDTHNILGLIFICCSLSATISNEPPEGKKVYSREFLLGFKKYYTQKPEGCEFPAELTEDISEKTGN